MGARSCARVDVGAHVGAGTGAGMVVVITRVQLQPLLHGSVAMVDIGGGKGVGTYILIIVAIMVAWVLLLLESSSW